MDDGGRSLKGMSGRNAMSINPASIETLPPMALSSARHDYMPNENIDCPKCAFVSVVTVSFATA
ncbi:hypothetical protein LB542_05035 [Mesorhizobium sp. BR1-1-9]|uniref:hypothetical protein n=1 Tax=unclassified Mesorhizobium TaxID=325217 RepID=UPI00112AAA51|nr:MULTISPECIES: hypothetical protein [unclassified Mesorhizobium]MBZ9811215.1 hypothetical protein [Mesorhizobium sp. ESP-6-2]MBZ9870229.1 hypothetical protein [Mesorhizobium sp. BR1-1-9]TPM25794.1 hypothetical protein FJ955_22265 [Mesorhizobium sp. B2-2-2]